jgi:hypothetical protein
MAAIARFKRKKAVPRPEILAKCGELGIDVEKLKEDLANGETSKDTATYFVLCQPITERPVIKVEAPPPEPPAPKAEEGLPLLNPGGTRKVSHPGQAPVPSPSKLRGRLSNPSGLARTAPVPVHQKSPGKPR